MCNHICNHMLHRVLSMCYLRKGYHSLDVVHLRQEAPHFEMAVNIIMNKYGIDIVFYFFPPVQRNGRRMLKKLQGIMNLDLSIAFGISDADTLMLR